MRERIVSSTPITEDDWVLGSPAASVTIVEYSDFECPYCAMARPALEGVLATDPDTRLVYRHFPLSTIHPHAVMAAEAAEASGTQGKFWQMHDLTFANQPRLEYQHLLSYAEALELDLKRFEEELLAHTHLDKVRRDFRRGIKDGVNGTPTIFINGLRYDGPRDRRSLLGTIAQLREEGAEEGAKHA